MYKKILIALDIADANAAKAVIGKANDLALNSKAELHTISVIPDYGTSMVASYFKPDHQSKAMHELGQEIDGQV